MPDIQPIDSREMMIRALMNKGPLGPTGIQQGFGAYGPVPSTMQPPPDPMLNQMAPPPMMRPPNPARVPYGGSMLGGIPGIAPGERLL